MEKKFTPGPWVAICGETWEYKKTGNMLQTCEVHTEKTRAQLNEEGHNYDKHLADVANITVCSIGTFQKDIMGEEAKANTLLIAASPELLDALKWTAAILQLACRSGRALEEGQFIESQGTSKTIAAILDEADAAIAKAIGVQVAENQKI